MLQHPSYDNIPHSVVPLLPCIATICAFKNTHSDSISGIPVTRANVYVIRVLPVNYNRRNTECGQDISCTGPFTIFIFPKSTCRGANKNNIRIAWMKCNGINSSKTFISFISSGYIKWPQVFPIAICGFCVGMFQ